MASIFTTRSRCWRVARLRCAEGGGGGDGYELGGVVEGEIQDAPHRRLAGEEEQQGKEKDALHISSRIAAIGSRRAAVRAGYHVAKIDKATATRFTPITSD